MSHLQYTAKNRKGKHLNYEERIKIEVLSKIGLKSEAIAKQIGCSGRTVCRELAKELDKTERKLGGKKFREKFKTITCDNDCENKSNKSLLCTPLQCMGKRF